jgi:hypothetical protein
MIVRIVLLLALALASANAQAQDYKVGTLAVERPYARVSAARNGAAYVTIVNTGNQPDRLIRAASPRSASVDAHHDHGRRHHAHAPGHGDRAPPTPGWRCGRAKARIMLIGLKAADHGQRLAGARLRARRQHRGHRRRGKTDAAKEA